MLKAIARLFLYPFADFEGTLLPFLIGAVTGLILPAPYWRWTAGAGVVAGACYAIGRRRRFRSPTSYVVSSLLVLACLAVLVLWVKL